MALAHGFNSCYVNQKGNFNAQESSPSYHSSHPLTGLAGISTLPSHGRCSDALGSHAHLFFGFLWAGEVCSPTATSFDPSWHICMGDLALDSHTALTKLFVTIKASKTDPFCHHPGKDRPPALPNVHPAPLFCFRDGSFLTRERFVREVRRLLTLAGIDPAPYSGHSFRIGAATTVAQAGLDAALIQTLGHWKSSAYQLYICIPRDSLATVSSLLAWYHKHATLLHLFRPLSLGVLLCFTLFPLDINGMAVSILFGVPFLYFDRV